MQMFIPLEIHSARACFLGLLRWAATYSAVAAQSKRWTQAVTIKVKSTVVC